MALWKTKRAQIDGRPSRGKKKKKEGRETKTNRAASSTNLTFPYFTLSVFPPIILAFSPFLCLSMWASLYSFLGYQPFCVYIQRVSRILQFRSAADEGASL